MLCLTGVSAALVFQQEVQAPSTPLRVVFDGDAVLFSDETDQIFQEQGLEGALQYERAMEAIPIGDVSMPPCFHGHPQALQSLLLGLCREQSEKHKSLQIPYASTTQSLVWAQSGVSLEMELLSPISDHQLLNI